MTLDNGVSVTLNGSRPVTDWDDFDCGLDPDADIRPLSGNPDLASYDLVLINTSAGKDSQVMLDVIVAKARSAGILDRLVAVHADLGEIEWAGTKDLAAEQVALYGVPFEVVRNPNWSDLLERIESRGRWPDMGNRYCTSEFKTGQVRKLMTALVELHRARRGLNPRGRDGRPVRILNCLGLRAEESPKRAKLSPFGFDKLSSNTKRHVDQWLPIHEWMLDDIWNHINARSVPHHWAYDIGMPRLSCALCVFASPSALKVGITHNPELAERYAAAERKMGHTFRHKFEIAELVGSTSTDDDIGPIEAWAA